MSHHSAPERPAALIFYLVHWIALGALAAIFGWFGRGGLVGSYVAAGLVVVAMVPLCLWYRRYKRAHPRGWARYV